MHTRKQLWAGLILAVGLLALPGCSDGLGLQLVNELSFSLDGVTDVTISYDEETVTFYSGDHDELIIREYMTEDKNSYHANVDHDGRSIKISEGGKPLFRGNFFRRVEVYLPASYTEALTVTTTDGDIDFSGLDVKLNELRIDSTIGMVRLGSVEARMIMLSSASGTLNAERLTGETIKVETTRGNFFCHEMNGRVNYVTTSGSAEIVSASGSGDYTVNSSGKLDVTFARVDGDLSFFNKNGDIQITLPAVLEFRFEATTKNGSISTTFQERLLVDGRTASGIVGKAPAVTVKAETKNGDIEVRQ